MKIHREGETLCISDLKELALANAAGFSEKTRDAICDGAKKIVVDLSDTGFVDCGGIGALIALRNNARLNHRDISVQLVNPPAPVKRILQLSHADEIFESAETAVSA